MEENADIKIASPSESVRSIVYGLTDGGESALKSSGLMLARDGFGYDVDNLKLPDLIIEWHKKGLKVT